MNEGILLVSVFCPTKEKYGPENNSTFGHFSRI